MNHKTPVYMELYQKIRSDIIHHVYSYGTKLPSKRTLAEKESCSVITAVHAYDLLAAEGYIESRMRSGYYVSYRSDDFFAVGEERIERTMMEFVKNDDKLISYNTIASAVRKAISVHQEALFVKSPWNGSAYLRHALAAYLAQVRAIYVEPDQIVIGSGTEYLYGLIADMIGTKKTYAIEDPSYMQIARTYEARGVRLVRMQLGKNGILTSELTCKHADVLHVTPYHSFPTGSTTDINKRKQYLAWAAENRAMIVEDDYDSEFAVGMNGRETLFSLDNGGNVIYLNTFANTISPSIRISYMVLPKKYMHAYQEKISFRSNTVSTFMQYVVAELIMSGSFERHINRVRKKLRK